MSIINTLYTFKYSFIILLGFVISFLVKRLYPKKSSVFHSILSFVISVIIVLSFSTANRVFFPLDLYFPEVKIMTTDNLNPKEKELVYNVDIVNRTNRDVDVVLTFTKEDSDLYPYIDIIPETYSTNVITIKAKERKDYVSSFIVDSDDSRLINSYYLKIKVKYDVQ